MKSEMTEKEARATLEASLNQTFSDFMWGRFKLAFSLEFAPDPKLPERFYFREPDGYDNKRGWVTDGPDGSLILFEVSHGGREQYRIDATRRACEWANAYPDLYRAAAALVGLGRMVHTRELLPLEELIRKGPKP